jgi:hypothetical protein
MSKAAVARLRFPRRRTPERVPFPEPVAELACGPVWRVEQISRYLDDCARGPAVTALSALANERPTSVDPAGPSTVTRPLTRESSGSRNRVRWFHSGRGGM